jgi:hypothetical protein
MKHLTCAAVCLCLLAAAGAVHAASRPIVGDYDLELRQGDHVDNAAMIQRLTELGVNTYFWLVWHSPNDWQDLQSFLPLADKAGISVWVYLVPHSESTIDAPTWPYSEPFKIDYVRWAEEIAKLSLKHRNLVGYVIDDFWGNVSPTRFSPEYVTKMVAAGKGINPRLRFYPLMYYPELEAPAFYRTIGPLVDGVVAAYPNDRAQIDRAADNLRNGYSLPTDVTIEFPAATPSKPGDRGFVSQSATVTDAAHAQFSFAYRDNFVGPTAGYHFLQLRVDKQVVWEKDVAGLGGGKATVDLSKAVAGKQRVRLELGVYDERGVGYFPLVADFGDLAVRGLRLTQPDLGSEKGWRPIVRGAFTIERWSSASQAQWRPLPLIVMPAGQEGEFAGRTGLPPTPENIAAGVATAMSALRDGKVEGVVTYCLDKSPTSKTFSAVKEALQGRGGGR